MYVRLAFSVAAHLNPEILIIDEVLAVGDAAFQRKCLGKMGDVSTQEGRTVLFVSHNMAAVESFCRRGVYLEKGRVVFDGDTREAIDAYLGGGGTGDHRGDGVFDLTRSERSGSTRDGSMLRRVELRRLDGTPADTVRMGEGLQIIVDVEDLNVPQHGVAAVITSETDVPLINLGSKMKPLEVYEPKAKAERVVLTIPALQLLPGKYWIDLRVMEGGRVARKATLDRVERAAIFEIVPADVFGSGYQFSSARELGVVFVEADWQIQKNGTVIAETAEVTGVSQQSPKPKKAKAQKNPSNGKSKG
jgi:lipopolysaccharide transport system ATP-binding protein